MKKIAAFIISCIIIASCHATQNVSIKSHLLDYFRSHREHHREIIDVMIKMNQLDDDLCQDCIVDQLKLACAINPTQLQILHYIEEQNSDAQVDQPTISQILFGNCCENLNREHIRDAIFALAHHTHRFLTVTLNECMYD